MTALFHDLNEGEERPGKGEGMKGTGLPRSEFELFIFRISGYNDTTARLKATSRFVR